MEKKSICNIIVTKCATGDGPFWHISKVNFLHLRLRLFEILAEGLASQFRNAVPLPKASDSKILFIIAIINITIQPTIGSSQNSIRNGDKPTNFIHSYLSI